MPGPGAGFVAVTTNAEIIAQYVAEKSLPDHFAGSAQTHFLPLADWLERKALGQQPFIFGVNGAQGSGKTTLAKFLQWILGHRGLRVMLLSLDDFYKHRADRDRLAREEHALLATRGVPGTHDIDLLADCLDALRKGGKDLVTEWPQFDKARDDRAATPQQYIGPVDLVLVEGWCVGTPAEQSSFLDEPLNELERTEDPDGRWRHYVNCRLGDDYRAVFRRIDALCFMQVPDLAAVHRWRGLQERKLAIELAGPAIMSEVELARFIQHFERLTRVAIRELPTRADWVLLLDQQHRCVSSTLRTR